MTEYKVSIVVPVYKAEKGLDQCVKSILNQTFSEFELILVDDGSPDNCPQLCDSWAERDDRIKVIHKENGGPQSAVKQGAEFADGKYITFIDSDDWVEPTYLQVLYDGLTENDADAAQCNYQQIDGDTKIKFSFPPRVIEGTNIRDDFLHTMANNQLPDIAAPRWAKMYKAELVRQGMEMCDLSINMGEDFLFNFAIFGLCKKIVILDSLPLYNYVRNPFGIMVKYNPNHILNKDKYFSNLKRIAQKHGCYCENIDVLKLRGYADFVYECAISEWPRKDKKEGIRTAMAAFDRKTWREGIKDLRSPMDKIGMYLYYFGLTDLALTLTDLSRMLRKWYVKHDSEKSIGE